MTKISMNIACPKCNSDKHLKRSICRPIRCTKCEKGFEIAELLKWNINIVTERDKRKLLEALEKEISKQLIEEVPADQELVVA